MAGLAWASLGMSRVAATIHKSAFASNMTQQVDDLNEWTKEILDGAFAAMVRIPHLKDETISNMTSELRQPDTKLHPRRQQLLRLLLLLRPSLSSLPQRYPLPTLLRLQLYQKGRQNTRRGDREHYGYGAVEHCG